MGETKYIIDVKRKKLIEELKKDNKNYFKIKRLKENIKRHKDWEIKRKRAKKNRIKWKER